MANKKNNTGLAGRMRAWMKAQTRCWPSKKLYDSLGLVGKDRVTASHALRDFHERGEVEKTAIGKWRYNHGWRPVAIRKGPVNSRIFKAAYVSISFATADIERLTGASRRTVYHTIRRLLEHGYLRRSGTQKQGRSRLPMWSVACRERFRKELL